MTEGEKKPLTTGIYQGVELYQIEIQVLKSIEDMLQKSVPHRDTVHFGFVAENKHIIKLNLFNRNLITLPESIGQLSALQLLILDENQLTTLPESIGQLSALQLLKLHNNQLTTLPESIGQLSALKSIILDNNQLITLPESIGQLSALKSLILDRNKLTQLPDNIGNLTALETLGLFDNQLTQLPDSIGNLTALKLLDWSGNHVNNLPDNIGQLSNLKWLNLYLNQLTEFPKVIEKLTNLLTLSLSNNLLTELPDFIGNLTALESLELKKNQLTQLPDSIGNLTALKTLRLSNNLLTELPDFIGNLTALDTLELFDNQLTQLPDSIGKLTALRLLDWGGNQLSNLPESIGQLANLRWLNLSNNQLTTLPESFDQLKELSKLYLSNNQLTTLPENIGQLRELKILHLDKNQITTLPESFEQLKELRRFKFYGKQDFDKFKRLWRNIEAKEQRLTVKQLIRQKIPFLKTEEQFKYKILKELLRKQSQGNFDKDQLNELYTIVESSRNLARLARKSRHDNYLGISTSLTRSFYGTFIAVGLIKFYDKIIGQSVNLQLFLIVLLTLFGAFVIIERLAKHQEELVQQQCYEFDKEARVDYSYTLEDYEVTVEKRYFELGAEMRSKRYNVLIGFSSNLIISSFTTVIFALFTSVDASTDAFTFLSSELNLQSLFGQIVLLALVLSGIAIGILLLVFVTQPVTEKNKIYELDQIITTYDEEKREYDKKQIEKIENMNEQSIRNQ